LTFPDSSARLWKPRLRCFAEGRRSFSVLPGWVSVRVHQSRAFGRKRRAWNDARWAAGLTVAPRRRELPRLPVAKAETTLAASDLASPII